MHDFGFLRPLPVPLGNTGTTDPDLSDLVGCTGRTVVRVDDQEFLVGEGLTAGDQLPALDCSASARVMDAA